MRKLEWLSVDDFATDKLVYISHFEKGEAVYLQEEDVSIIYKDEQILFVKVENEYIKFLVMNAHCPHTGYDDHSIEIFWGKLKSLILPAWQGFPVVFLGDTNARMGQDTNELVGGHGAEQGTKASTCFLQFLTEQRLWLPATFEATQKVTATLGTTQPVLAHALTIVQFLWLGRLWL